MSVHVSVHVRPCVRPCPAHVRPILVKAPTLTPGYFNNPPVRPGSLSQIISLSTFDPARTGQTKSRHFIETPNRAIS